MQIQQTKIVQIPDNQAIIEMLIADAPEGDGPSEHLAIRVQVGADRKAQLVRLELIALRRARSLLDAQIDAIQHLVSP